MFEWISTPEAWIALITLTSLEIVLGIDNIIFISILVGRLPVEKRNKGRLIGLTLAMFARILLLLSLTWIMRLTSPLFEIYNLEISGRDLILILGGLFLLAKSTHEIHTSLEGQEESSTSKAVAGFASVLIQITLLDIVFSLDSVITAVGLAKDLEVMIFAIIFAVVIMMISAKALGDFVDSHPTIKMLALSFLILVGVSLIAEGFDMHIPKGYIYFSMAFSIGVEFLNMKIRKKTGDKIKLRKTVSG
jgi:predicted tellurium resistance membrane protein TerC